MLRIRQWSKNLFVFLPLIFGGGLLSLPKVLAAIGAFFCFSFMASAIYIINDIADRESDRLHPVKRNRAIASGRVSIASAATIAAFLACLSIAGSVVMMQGYWGVAAIIIAYFLLNLVYTKWLKHFAIIDVMTIAVGFVLRVFAGGVACGIPVSPWLSVMVFMLTLFIAFGKRRDDLLIKDAGIETRRSVSEYSLPFVDTVMSILSAVLLIAYIIYTLTPEVMCRFGSQYVYVTALFVVAGIMRFLQLTIVRKQSGQPDELLWRDPFILTCVIAWLLSFIIIIYL